MENIQEYPEEPGYKSAQGFVKGNPLNNKSYITKYVRDDKELADLLFELDREIELINPGYNIVQIKDKFGGLRYYTGGGLENLTDDKYSAIQLLISMAEKRYAELFGKR